MQGFLWFQAWNEGAWSIEMMDRTHYKLCYYWWFAVTIAFEVHTVTAHITRSAFFAYIFSIDLERRERHLSYGFSTTYQIYFICTHTCVTESGYDERRAGSHWWNAWFKVHVNFKKWIQHCSVLSTTRPQKCPLGCLGAIVAGALPMGITKTSHKYSLWNCQINMLGQLPEYANGYIRSYICDHHPESTKV